MSYTEMQLWGLLERLYDASEAVAEHEVVNPDPEERVRLATLYAVMEEVKLQLDYKANAPGEIAQSPKSKVSAQNPSPTGDGVPTTPKGYGP